MTMHEEWTDQLSDYLDGELSAERQAAVDLHLRGCTDCTAVLNDLKRVVARARSVEARPPQADLWAGIAERSDAGRPSTRSFPSGHGPAFLSRSPRRVSFTLPQLAAAALVVAAASGGLAWELRPSLSGGPALRQAEGIPSSSKDQGLRYGSAASPSATPSGGGAQAFGPADGERAATSFDDARTENAGMAEAQYDAAVADLEGAVKKGRGRLDASTIAIVEHNLQIIDRAISQAREALAGDPANSYLSSHLVEARRRKLDLLRRAAALTSETN